MLDLALLAHTNLYLPQPHSRRPRPSQEAGAYRVDVVDRDLLNLAHDIVLPAEVQHLLGLLNAANQAAAHQRTLCSKA